MIRVLFDAVRVSPNGHAHTPKRRLTDKGLRYVLECCRALFNYAAKRRHLSPYAENPFRTLEIDRIPVEQVRPIELFTREQEQAFLEACDAWQFPLFLTLMLTGLRPGELTHLLLPDDLDLAAGVLRVRNKPQLTRAGRCSTRSWPDASPRARRPRGRYRGGRSSSGWPAACGATWVP